MTYSKFNRIAVPAFLASSLWLAPAFAQDKPDAAAPDQSQAQETQPQASQAPAAAVDPAQVLATVNGKEITAADVEIARQDIGQALAQLPPAQQGTVLINYLIDMHLLASRAEEQKLTDSEDFQRRLAYYRDRSLMQAAIDQRMQAAVTDEAAQTFYEEIKGELVPEGAEEIRASHILVETEEEAKEVISQLEGGTDFAELAKEKSIDPAGQNGGDLGYFGKGQMVPPFEEAAFALEEGSVSAPVESQFGWHVIRLEDRRPMEAPSLEEVRAQVNQVLARQARNEFVQELREGAEITIDGQPVETQGEEAPAEGETEAPEQPQQQ